ncbi:peroxidase 27-like [Phoenix dactylifera]|uniref:Peroxidase n=1 Tax=Phoenix dactylifera TaxID=42345 RepID=A0A8B8ZLE1_PHODC|nr:peroxidase 27-like [Phoenix dactylifera]
MAPKDVPSMILLNLALVLLLLGSSDAQGLQVGFYQKTCPKAEEIIRKEMTTIMSLAPSLAGPLLRMHFHDCFVRGCDASILLNGTDQNNPAEKDGRPNLSLRGYGVIDRIKAKLEKACPGIVSCADILALVARDGVLLTKGPYWEVPTGRRDGKISVASETLTNLPPPFFSTSQILNLFFIPKGLNAKDLVVLSGGHTIGTSHCSSFSNRLYNFTGNGDADPMLDKNYLPKLKSKCRPNDATTIVEMDPGSFKTFDTSYYKLVAKRRALFTSDATLILDSQTKAYVERQAQANGFPSEFFRDFGESMVKMGNIEVLTGNQGEIRKKCAFVN